MLTGQIFRKPFLFLKEREGNDPADLGRGPLRWASAGLTQPTTPSTAAPAAVGGLADVPIAGRVGEIPVASSPAGSVSAKNLDCAPDHSGFE
jgi:hypothetical protein